MRVVTEAMPVVNRGRRSGYNWDTFLNGQRNLLVRGEDYTCKDVTMKVQLRNKAALRHLQIRIWDHAEGVVVEAQIPQTGPTPVQTEIVPQTVANNVPEAISPVETRSDGEFSLVGASVNGDHGKNGNGHNRRRK